MVGLPAAGKSTVVNEYKNKGFEVLSRDIEGGTMNGLHIKFVEQVQRGIEKILLDNTNLTADIRKPFIDAAVSRKTHLTS